MKTKLSQTQKHLISLIEDATKKNGEGLTMIISYKTTVNALVKKGVIKLVPSPFCKGNTLMKLI